MYKQFSGYVCTVPSVYQSVLIPTYANITTYIQLLTNTYKLQKPKTNSPPIANSNEVVCSVPPPYLLLLIMIQTILARTIHPLPVPLFGSVKTASLFLCAKSKALPRMLGWSVPLSTGALWFVWPAVDDGWKQSMGLKKEVKAV